MIDNLNHPIAVLGNFDGVHNGHRRIFTCAIEKAKREKKSVVALTFWPHPSRFFTHPVPLIQTLEQRTECLYSLGIVRVEVIPFDLIASLEPEEFLPYLLKQISISSLVVGEEFRFGRERRGNLSMLRALARPLGIEIKGLPVVKLLGGKIGSSSIRFHLQEGNLQRSRLLLGGFYSVEGVVEQGVQRGRELGFPTANMVPENDPLLPPGVYLTRVEREGEFKDSLTYIGSCPTFSASNRLRYETFLLDFQGDLYGQRLRIYFIQRLRGDITFPSSKELKAQMGEDLAYARNLLA